MPGIAAKEAAREQGQRLAFRRGVLGISRVELAREAKIDRGTLSKIEAGETGMQRSKVSAVESALTRLEGEAGLSAAPIEDPAAGSAGLISIELPTADGARVIVRGPVGDLDALTAAAERLLRAAQHSPDGD